jgi:hypothetical protein
MGMPSSNSVNGTPPWVRPGEGFTSLENDGIIKPSEREEVVIVPLYGTIQDSPVITAIQHSTRKAKKRANAEREFEYAMYGFNILLGPLMRRIEKKLEKSGE